MRACFADIYELSFSFSLHNHGTKHSSFHVIKKMTVIRPVSPGVGADSIGEAFRWIQADRVLAHLKLSVSRFQVAPQSVQVDGMSHHRVIDQHEPNPLAELEHNGLRLTELHAVELPHIAVHIARKMKLDLTSRRVVVGWLDNGVEIGICQNPAAVVA